MVGNVYEEGTSLNTMAVNYGGKALGASASVLGARPRPARYMSSKLFAYYRHARLDGGTKRSSKQLVGQAKYDSVELARVQKCYPFSTTETIMAACTSIPFSFR
jgi:hypothetical protein